MKSKFYCVLLLSVANVSCVASSKKYETFDIHFVVITPNPLAHSTVKLAQLKNEVDILNTYFVKEDRSPIIKFNFKSASFYNEIQNSSCSFVALNNGNRVYNADIWARHFNLCNDPKVRDPHAINFYVFDSYTLKQGFKNRDGHGKRNGNRPFLLLDWERLNHNVQAPEEHEMGHAFGLNHVCALGAKPDSSTNIMASSCKGGSTGKRDIGFNDEQVKKIMHYVPLIKEKLAVKK
ncbi:zinc-dependent metalloprotease [Acinetobacter sp. NIPH 1852]|uniref:zinc-dependent metalloprotease n=1 Tax=Acinetobacter sp. NIPH 1852 TaxID=2923428 RepID=UPI001F4B1419|nr:zinc-dependent metalloprotease [Acinetobacter sp. NIPH 1852]MCH7309443.1 zinc-dependent metalloprotease [Acinetobacter sp. NIPH 1852]